MDRRDDEVRLGRQEAEDLALDRCACRTACAMPGRPDPGEGTGTSGQRLCRAKRDRVASKRSTGASYLITEMKLFTCRIGHVVSEEATS